MRRALVVVVALLAASCSPQGERTIVAAGTTVVDSGLLERLVDEYRGSGGEGDFSVVGVSTLEVLELGERGSADLLVSHRPDLEEEFLRDHPLAMGTPLVTSTFLLVGPADQELVKPGDDIVDAFRAIAASGRDFVARGDGSGTAARERSIWERAQIIPDGMPWYVETGQGMGFTLQVADQRRGFTLAEEGTFVAASRSLSLVAVPVTASDGLLTNPYRAIVVNPMESPDAGAFVTWLTSGEGVGAILAANQELFGSLVYRPAG